jgi:hypothetical protein
MDIHIQLLEPEAAESSIQIIVILSVDQEQLQQMELLLEVLFLWQLPDLQVAQVLLLVHHNKKGDKGL